MVWSLVLGLASLAAAAPKAPAAARKPAAPFDVTTLDGRRVTLEELRGRIVILDFWATWCPPCRAEIPHFNALYEKYRDRLEIVGISLDQEGREVVEPFVRRYSVSYPIAIETDGRLSRAYGGIRGIPTTFVIDRQGRIYAKYVGYQELKVFERDLTTLLAEP